MSAQPLPPYTYTPGVTPHPISDPAGHSHGHAAAAVTVNAERLSESPAFQRAVQLFQHGYYWEAHEEWESVWHAVGRRGPVADLLKGLIKLAAAGVKAREGNTDGVRRHTRRAVELLSPASSGENSTPGVDRQALSAITQQASSVAKSTTMYTSLDHGCPVIFWPDLAGELNRL
jgi:uncharacterized protein